MMFKPIVQMCGIALIALAATAAQAAQSDPLTGMPIFPGTSYVSKASQDVCGTTVSTATYSPGTAMLNTIEAWFTAHLTGFKLVHGTVWRSPYDAFVNADTTSSVSIVGSDTKNGVDAVYYHRNAKPASTDKTKTS